MFIKLYKVNKNAKDYYLSVIHLNTSQIVYMSEDSDMKKVFTEGKLNIDLHDQACFTRLRLATKSGVEEITVVDTPAAIESKIMTTSTRQLLRD
tara:strand:+ start:74 stop:355 length:282 start_codon:yes stop_codon:yes gene_type:complete